MKPVYFTRRLCIAFLVWKELIDATISNLRLQTHAFYQNSFESV